MNLLRMYSIADACAAVRIGKTAIYEAIRSGALRAVKCGRRTLILDEDLRRFMQSLPSINVNSLNQSTNRSKANV